jgi:hypothetical protein
VRHPILQGCLVQADNINAQSRWLPSLVVFLPASGLFHHAKSLAQTFHFSSKFSKAPWTRLDKENSFSDLLLVIRNLL